MLLITSRFEIAVRTNRTNLQVLAMKETKRETAACNGTKIGGLSGVGQIKGSTHDVMPMKFANQIFYPNRHDFWPKSFGDHGRVETPSESRLWT
jgi:hypothetical protein